MKLDTFSFDPGTRSSCGSPPTLGGCNRVEEELRQDTRAFREFAIVSVAAAASIIIAVLGLMGYIPGLDVLGRVRGAYIPMAPSTAVSFLLLGGILLGPARNSWHPRWGTIARAVALLVALFGLLEVIGPVVDKDLNFEDTLVPSDGHLGSIPVARMSPSTGGVFVFAGLALLIQAASHDRRVTLAHWSGGLGSLVFVGGLVFLLAYIQGTPLLYGEGSTVPMAVTTALAFLMLGIATVAASGQDGTPLRLVTGRSTRARLLRVFLPLTTSAVLIASVVVLRAPFLSEVNAALISAGAVVMVAMVTGIVVALTSRSVGDALDSAEAERKRAEEALRESERLLLESQSVAQVGSYVLDIPSGVWKSSPVLDHIFGIGEDYERSVDGWLALAHPDVRQSMADHFTHDVLEKHGRFDREYRVVRHDDGSERWVLGLGKLEFDAQGRPLRMIGTIQDITERKQAEDELRKLSRAVEQSPSLVMITDPNGDIEYVNPKFSEVTGYLPEEVMGKNPRILQSGETSPDGYSDLWQTITSGGEWRGDLRNKRKNGEFYWAFAVISAVTDEEGAITHFVSVQEDVTERKQAEEALHHLAYHDALTGLPNRTLFMDRLKAALVQARRNKQAVAVMFLDLDHLKVVNDALGHSAGDQLLRSAAERLTALVREGDTVACMGGDEFAVLLPHIAGAEEASEVAQRVIEACRRTWDIDGHEFHVTASMGITIYPSDGEDAESLIRNADTAMYRAKERGRDNYQLYTPAMNAKIVERLALENGLRHGLEREEFVVHYQPQVDISSRRIVGTEALVRWQDPERGLVSPAEFIAVAEEAGLIVPLGTWVLQTACAQNVAWQQAGHPPMPVAVNFSARQFEERDLLDTVTQALEESGMDPQYLQLEITEGVAMQDAESTATTLRALREMGVRIAIDDFGIGHSSLSYLKHFPIDVLKIDRSFVRDITVDPDDAAITAAIIAMAKSLKLKVIAEGVETEEQLAFLKEHGCDEMQGFLFSKAVPAPALEKMLARGNRPRALARSSG